MDESIETFDCVIVGAGIAGLLAAALLKRAGASVCVLEKGRGLGGRMATRRRDGAVFDHGAQFFTARDNRFRTWVKRWEQQGLVEPWYELPESGIHYRGVPGMTAIAKHLVEDNLLDVRRDVVVEEARHKGAEWTVTSRDGQSFAARSLLLTAPVPQSLALLNAGETHLSHAKRQQLEAIRFHRCIAALAILENESTLIEHGGALNLAAGPVQWIADNQRKGISLLPSVTIHSSPAFAEEHWESDDAVRLPKMLAAAAPHLHADVVSCHGHRWGFSQPVGSFDNDAFVDSGRQLAIAGDGLAGGRAEGAAVSGMAAARELASCLGF